MLIFTSALLVFLIDRTTKAQALKCPFFSLSSFLTFSTTKNPGIAFGLFRERGEIIFCLTLIICISLIIYAISLKKGSMFFKIGIGMIIGGAISNLLDRLIHGSVIDFISIGLGALRWPTFNLADCGIVIGGLLVFLSAHFLH